VAASHSTVSAALV
jgi:ribonuclease HI